MVSYIMLRNGYFDLFGVSSDGVILDGGYIITINYGMLDFYHFCNAKQPFIDNNGVVKILG